MDQNNTNGTGFATQKSQKRGNNDRLEDKRRSKRRKFAIVGEEWGNKKGSDGLELKLEEAVHKHSTGPLLEPEPIPGGYKPRKEVDTQFMVGTDPSKDAINLSEAGTLNGGSTEDTLNASTGPLLTNGPHQLEGNIAVGVEHVTVEPDSTGDEQLGTQSRVEQVSTKDMSTNNNEDNLYDTAATIRMLREDRGTCNVRRGWCNEHKALARKITSIKKVWTKSKKTGLYSYCSRRMSVWRCNVNMGILPGTMEPRDGAGEAGLRSETV